MKNQKLIEAALEAGAVKAVIIQGSDIVLSPAFRDICKSNQCGGYGRCWMCPPDIGPIDQLMEQVRAYPKGLWYQSVAKIEDSFDIEGMFAAGQEHALLSQRIQKNVVSVLDEKFLHLSCGGCHLCPTCAKVSGEPCRMPDQALSSLEGYGVDVYQTTKNTPLQYINGPDTVTYFGIVLFTE